VLYINIFNAFKKRVRSAKEAGGKVVDVDGSYLHRKQTASTSGFDPDTTPPAPLVGWVSVDSAASVNVQNIPKVTHGKAYNIYRICDLIAVCIYFRATIHLPSRLCRQERGGRSLSFTSEGF
jgi:hypothetical protein